jgi:excisionase family DNA binding protein
MKSDIPTGPRSAGPRFFSIAKIAVQLDVSVKTVRREIKRGELPAHLIGRQHRISEWDLAAYIARRRRGWGPEPW